MDDTATALTVGAVARLAGVTVRTLHHYDEIGLVSPGDRTDAGYRLYGRGEIERLQEVLFFRELGFGLDEITQMVDEPGYQRAGALHRQRGLLEAKAERLLRMIGAVDEAIENVRTGMNTTPEDMLEVFGDFDPAEHQEEAEERWGDTDAYAESMRRTSRYTKDDWIRLRDEADAINRAFLDLMERGVPADSVDAMEVAERHRKHIGDWFYDCSIEIHRGLGEMYVSDERFRANIDKAGEGLAGYQSQAIAANADRQSG